MDYSPLGETVAGVFCGKRPRELLDAYSEGFAYEHCLNEVESPLAHFILAYVALWDL